MAFGKHYLSSASLYLCGCVCGVCYWLNEWSIRRMRVRNDVEPSWKHIHSITTTKRLFLIISTITAIDADPIFIPIIHFTILYLSIMGYRCFSLKRIVRLSLSHHGKNASSPQHCSTNHQRVSRNLDSERFLIFLTKCTSFITTSCHSYRDELWVLMWAILIMVAQPFLNFITMWK